MTTVAFLARPATVVGFALAVSHTDDPEESP